MRGRERNSAKGARKIAKRRFGVVNGIAEVGRRRAVNFRGPSVCSPDAEEGSAGVASRVDAVWRWTRTAGRGGIREHVSEDVTVGGWVGFLTDTV